MFEEIALNINATEVIISNTEMTTTVTFQMLSLADTHKAVRILQEAGYPAYNAQKHKVEMRLSNYKTFELGVGPDDYPDIRKTTAVAPQTTLQKHVDYRFQMLEEIIKDNNEKIKKPKLKRKLQTDDTFRYRRGVYKFVGDYMLVEGE